MAGQAYGFAVRRLEAELARDGDEIVAEQVAVSLAVRVAARPDGVFVVPDVGIDMRNHRAVANAVGAGSDAGVHPLVVDRQRWLGRRGRGKPAREQQGHENSGCDSDRVHRVGDLSVSSTYHGLPSSPRYSRCISSSVNGREPRRPKTAIWLPVSSTARSRSSPFDNDNATPDVG